MPAINLTKGDQKVKTSDVGGIQKMEVGMKTFVDCLQVKNNEFQAEEAFEKLRSYIIRYDRILYSSISNIIYSAYENSGGEDLPGTIGSNLDALVAYSMDSEIIMKKKMDLEEKSDEKIIDDTRKVILKIWDHVSLANQQYKELKQTDEEYNEKFERHISLYKEEMTKEMSAQLLTMVSIFTALAFLIFGGISSLDNVFSIAGIPVLKVLIAGLVWGICIFNLIFLFLFCVSKMTGLHFKSTDVPNATVFQKYSVVWWCNLILIALLAICMWFYFMQYFGLHSWVVNICIINAKMITIAGCALIFVAIFMSVKKLAVATGISKNRDAED